MHSETFVMEPIAHIRSDFREKFGIPRQSGLVDSLTARVVLEPYCRNPEALRGIEDFDYLWLIWKFSANHHDGWKPTVRPPRLGGNARIGVFATRSPYRPNPMGLSCVKLVGVDWEAADGPALIVAGADLLDGTPIYDIKPYIAYTDSHPEATEGFAAGVKDKELQVDFPEELLKILPTGKQKAIIGVLAQDPRPAYDADETRLYGVEFAGFDVRFIVTGNLLTVRELVKLK